MMRAYLVGSDEFILRLKEMPGVLRKALYRAVSIQTINLQRYVKENKLNMPVAERWGAGSTGQALHVRTGILRDSIASSVENSSTGVVGTVGTRVWYGAMWEFGFERTVGAGSRGKNLGIMKQGALAAYMLKHGASRSETVEPRSFLRSSLDENMPTIREALTRAVKDAAEAIHK
jgi:phage gpG-like protein